MKIQLESKFWYNSDNIYVIGYAVTPDGTYLHHGSFCDYIITNKTNISQALSRLNGQFSVIIRDDETVILASDISKAYIIFFSDEIITDDPTLFVGLPFNKNAQKHLSKMSSVLCDETLLTGVRQVLGGHIFIINNGHVEDQRFCGLLGSQCKNLSEQDLATTITTIFEQIGRTLLREDGSERQVVLSLSGGYDSRIVAERLVNQLHHKNLLFYTMGCLDSNEQSIALKVADTLGVECHRIDFSQTVKDVSINKEILKAIHYVGALSNFCHIADYHAIKYLQEQKLIQEDAIFMAGHIGDTFGGSTVRKWRIDESDSYCTIANKIMLSEYRKPCIFDQEASSRIQNIIKSYQEQDSNAMHIAMQFSLDNISSNGCGTESRYYTYFGYEMRLPLYSSPLVEFSSQISADTISMNDLLYNHTLENCFFKDAGINFTKTMLPQSAFVKQHIKNLIKALLPRHFSTKHKFRGADLLFEEYLTQDMKQQLIDNGIIKHSDDYLSFNEIMNLFYIYSLKRSSLLDHLH